MRQLVPVIGLVALLCIVFAVMLLDDSDEPVSGTIQGARVGSDVEREADARPDDGEEVAATGPIATSRYTDRSSVADSLNVRVVDEGTGSPQAGTVVHYLQRDALPPLEDLMGSPEGLDLEAGILRFGSRHTADESGVAAVPAPTGEGWVCARRDGLFGIARFTGETTGDLPLRLSPAVALQVRVVRDGGGGVADAPVVVQALRNNGAPGPMVWRGTTGGDGEVTITDLVAAVRARGIEDPKFVASLGLVGQGAAATALKTTGVTTLVMSPTGRLEIDVRGGSRRSWNLRLRSRGLLPADADSTRMLPMKLGALLPPGFHQVSGTHSPYVFDHVAAGEALVLEVHDPLNEFRTQRFLVDGPTAEGAVSVFEAVMEHRHPGFTGRAVDSDGTAITETPIAVRGCPVGIVKGATILTDDRGVFRIPYRFAPQATGAITLAAGDRVARRELSEVGSDGVHLGDMVFALVPVAIGGRVQDEAGQPVGGAKVVLTSGPAEPGPGVPASPDSASAVTDADGRFVIRAPLSSPQVRLQAWCRGFAADDGETVLTRTAPSRSEDIVLTLTSTGSLRGRVTVDEGVPLDAVELVAQPYGRTVRPLADGTFRIDNVPCGAITVEVFVATGGQRGAPVATVDRLEVRRDALLEDDRLDTIDLRGLLHVYRLSTVDAQGAPLGDAEVTVRETDSNSPRLVLATAERSKRTVVAAASSLMVTVTAPGHVRWTGEVRPGPNRLVLDRAPAVTLVLAPGSAHPRYPAKVVVSLVEDRPGGLVVDTPAAALTADWTSTVEVPSTGRFRVELMIIAEGTPTGDPETVQAGSVEVGGDAGQRISILVPGGPWQQRRN